MVGRSTPRCHHNSRGSVPGTPASPIDRFSEGLSRAAGSHSASKAEASWPPCFVCVGCFVRTAGRRTFRTESSQTIPIGGNPDRLPPSVDRPNSAEQTATDFKTTRALQNRNSKIISDTAAPFVVSTGLTEPRSNSRTTGDCRQRTPDSKKILDLHFD